MGLSRPALGLDDPAYTKSWEGEHFPGLKGGRIHLLNGQGGHGTSGSHAGGMHASDGSPILQGQTSNVWAPNAPQQ